mmetsp:Transcript_34439/g.78278  ORF Transcript_34439/g.78278 Transcript_34439/m.78278 type:complete len:238 (+) Transcript_34439:3596-4309(+)
MLHGDHLEEALGIRRYLRVLIDHLLRPQPKAVAGAEEEDSLQQLREIALSGSVSVPFQRRGFQRPVVHENRVKGYQLQVLGASRAATHLLLLRCRWSLEDGAPARAGLAAAARRRRRDLPTPARGDKGYQEVPLVGCRHLGVLHEGPQCCAEVRGGVNVRLRHAIDEVLRRILVLLHEEWVQVEEGRFHALSSPRSLKAGTEDVFGAPLQVRRGAVARPVLRRVLNQDVATRHAVPQ